MEKFKDAFRKTQGYAAFKGSLMRDEVIFSRESGAFKLPYVQDCFVTFSAGRVSIAIQPEEPPAPVLNVDDWFDIPVPPFPNLETAPRISRSRYSDLETYLLGRLRKPLEPPRSPIIPASHFDFEGDDPQAAETLFKKAGLK